MMKFNNKDINKMYIGDTLVNRVNDGDFQYMPKHDYASDYLTFDIISGGTVVFSLRRNNTAYTKTISASTDNGQTWTEMQSRYRQSASTINVSAGDRVIFKGTNAAYGNSQNYSSMFSGSTAYFNVEGNIMSLIYGDDFRGQTTLTEDYTFRTLFEYTNVISAENLILPATTLADICYGAMFYQCTSLTTPPELPAMTLADFCYASMFYRCSSLTTAPELPATALTEYCYASMFYACTNLNYIKCLATNISANGCTQGWVDHVAGNGTFVKASSMNDWPTGTSGIPEGWTIENE